MKPPNFQDEVIKQQAIADSLVSFKRNEVDPRVGTSQVWLENYVSKVPIHAVFSSSQHAYLDFAFQRPYPCGGSFVERWGTKRSEPIGKALFIPPGIPMLGTCPPGPFVKLTCLLDATFFDELAANLSERALERCLDIREPRVLDNLRQAYFELLRPKFAANLMVEAQIISACVGIARHLQKSPGRKRGGLPRWKVKIIEERLREDKPIPPVSELARLCGMSTRHLARAFSEENGHSISQHVRAASLARAQQMLAEGELSLKEIAAKLGFSSRSTFSVAYRRQTGRSPLRDHAGHAPDKVPREA